MSNGLHDRYQSHYHVVSSYSTVMVSSELRDIFFIPRIVGTFSFNKYFEWSNTLMLFCLFIKLVGLFSSIDRFLNPIIFAKRLFNSTDHIFRLRLAIIPQSVLANIFCLFWWRNRKDVVSGLLKNIDTAAIRFSNRKIRTYFRFVHNYLFAFVLLIIASISFLTFYIVKFSFHLLVQQLAMLITVSSTISSISQFCGIVQLVTYLLREATRYYSESSVHFIEQFSSLCDSIDELFSPINLVLITQSFLLTIFSLYSLLLPLYPGLWMLNTLMVEFLMFNVSQVICVIYCSNNLKNEVIFKTGDFLF